MSSRKKLTYVRVGGGAPTKKMSVKKVPQYLKGFARIGGLYRKKPSEEVKFLDGNLPSQTIGGAGTDIIVQPTLPGVGPNTTLLQIPQGTGMSQRIGKRVTLKSIDMKIYVENATTAGAVASQFAWALVLDKQCNGSLPNNSAVFAGPGTTSGSHKLALCRPEMENSLRFRILKRGVVSFPNPGNGASGDQKFPKLIQFHKKLNLTLDYNGTTGDLSELRSNNLILWVGVTQTTHAVTMYASYRLRYEDC